MKRSLDPSGGIARSYPAKRRNSKGRITYEHVNISDYGQAHLGDVTQVNVYLQDELVVRLPDNGQCHHTIAEGHTIRPSRSWVQHTPYYVVLSNRKGVQQATRLQQWLDDQSVQMRALAKAIARAVQHG